MFGRADREKERYYLLPGMGGRARRRKFVRNLVASVIVGVFVATLFGFLLWWMNRNRL